MSGNYTDGTLPAGFEDALVEASDAERERHIERIAALEAERDEARTVLGQAIADATALKVRAEVAEARLAELVREVRDWWHEANDDGESLERTLAKYEGGP